MSDEYVHALAAMGTAITIRVIGHGTEPVARERRGRAVERAIEWFRVIEKTCTRFDEQSELRQLSATVGKPFRASPLLFQSVRFAVEVAAETGGAFDPTVGQRMEARGFNREYRSGQAVSSGAATVPAASYRDVQIDAARGTITLRRPLTLDLGAVAKGFAVDLAARELAVLENFSIDAGGDLFLRGHNAGGEPWSVGIRHPRAPGQLIRKLRLSNTAVCTSGDYERRSPVTVGDHHLMDPRTGRTSTQAASVTVLAPSAMMADVLATAAFVLGPQAGLRLLEEYGVAGLIVTPALEESTTRGFPDD